MMYEYTLAQSQHEVSLNHHGCEIKVEAGNKATARLLNS